MRIWNLLCGGLLILNIAGCANKPATVTTSTVPSTTTKGVPAQSAGFTALQKVVGATKAAIESGKVDVAKTEFAKFEASWKTVEDGVKTRSPESYKAIEDGVQSVETGIGSKQAKETLLTSLQKLSQSIDKARK